MKRILSILVLVSVVMNLAGQGKFTDKRDGNVYRTISVQGVTWMAENLRFRAPQGSAYFERDSTNSGRYGILYDWTTAMKVCPEGWHLPSGEQFQVLVSYNDQKGTWKSQKPQSDSFGVQLAGMQDYEGTFSEAEESAYFWTSTEYDKENAQYASYVIVSDNPVSDVSRKEDISDLHGAEKSNKYSVRCVKTR
ncbi:MAG TPA: FISUMP domain-containing protein [Bacteroidales bacterium]|nr:FISUMP domain-containing protein [Bacteroidales bacterium]